MKSITIGLLALPLCACVSIELPNLVSDTTKVAKDAYLAVYPDQAAPPASAASATGRTTLAHSYVGSDTQTVAGLKQACVAEAAQKLNQISGRTVRHSVVENEVVTINGRPVANCKLMVEG